MTEKRHPLWPFAVFMIWAVIALSDIGFIVMMAIDPLFGLGAFVLTLGAILAFMLGWLPLPGDRKGRR